VKSKVVAKCWVSTNFARLRAKTHPDDKGVGPVGECSPSQKVRKAEPGANPDQRENFATTPVKAKA